MLHLQLTCSRIMRMAPPLISPPGWNWKLTRFMSMHGYRIPCA
ncbi:unnamed protein product [Rhodiola kirilowii]